MFALDFFFEVLFITSDVHLLFLYCCWGFIHSLWHNKWYLKLLYLFELNLCREPSCGQIHIWTDVKVAVAIICATGKSFGLSRQECRTVQESHVHVLIAFMTNPLQRRCSIYSTFWEDIFSALRAIYLDIGDWQKVDRKVRLVWGDHHGLGKNKNYGCSRTAPWS